MHVTSSQRLHRKKAKDGLVNAMDCIKPFYPKIVVSSVLGPRDVTEVITIAAALSQLEVLSYPPTHVIVG
jgi:ribosomal protein L30E